MLVVSPAPRKQMWSVTYVFARCFYRPWREVSAEASRKHLLWDWFIQKHTLSNSIRVSNSNEILYFCLCLSTDSHLIMRLIVFLANQYWSFTFIAVSSVSIENYQLIWTTILVWVCARSFSASDAEGKEMCVYLYIHRYIFIYIYIYTVH